MLFTPCSSTHQKMFQGLAVAVTQVRSPFLGASATYCPARATSASVYRGTGQLIATSRGSWTEGMRTTATPGLCLSVMLCATAAKTAPTGWFREEWASDYGSSPQRAVGGACAPWRPFHAGLLCVSMPAR